MALGSSICLLRVNRYPTRPVRIVVGFTSEFTRTGARNVRFGSKAEKLNASKCFPLCPRKRTLLRIPASRHSGCSPIGSYGISWRCVKRSPSCASPFLEFRLERQKGDFGACKFCSTSVSSMTRLVPARLAALSTVGSGLVAAIFLHQ
jgi:hypothetical protein